MEDDYGRTDATEERLSDPDSSHGDTDAIRRVLVRRFDHWLRKTLAAESPPEGIAERILSEVGEPSEDENLPDRIDDEFSLRSAMTALAQEVKLQGRAFQRLSEAIGPVADTGVSLQDRLRSQDETLLATREAVEKARETLQAADRHAALEDSKRARKDLLEAMLDARDRLVRGLAAVREREESVGEPRGMDRLFGPWRRTRRHHAEILAALREGYEMSLARLDESLTGLGVRRIECEGVTFDPTRMVAADAEERTDTPDGTVIEVYRNGYEWNGELFRAAQVKVARTPQSQ